VIGDGPTPEKVELMQFLRSQVQTTARSRTRPGMEQLLQARVVLGRRLAAAQSPTVQVASAARGSRGTASVARLERRLDSGLRDAKRPIASPDPTAPPTSCGRPRRQRRFKAIRSDRILNLCSTRNDAVQAKRDGPGNEANRPEYTSAITTIATMSSTTPPSA